MCATSNAATIIGHNLKIRVQPIAKFFSRFSHNIASLPDAMRGKSVRCAKPRQKAVQLSSEPDDGMEDRRMMSRREYVNRQSDALVFVLGRFVWPTHILSAGLFVWLLRTDIILRL